MMMQSWLELEKMVEGLAEKASDGDENEYAPGHQLGAVILNAQCPLE